MGEIKCNTSCTGYIFTGDVLVPMRLLNHLISHKKYEKAINRCKEGNEVLPIRLSKDNLLIGGLASLLAAIKLNIPYIPYILDTDVKEKYLDGFMYSWDIDLKALLEAESAYTDHVYKITDIKLEPVINSFDIQALQLYANQDGKCYICGRQMTLKDKGSKLDKATVDHVIPVSLGGRNILNNKRLACKRCNELKGALFISKELINIIKEQRVREEILQTKGKEQ